MDTLTERQRQVRDRLRKRVPVTEIADDLGITRSAVYSQIRALKKKGAIAPEFTSSGRPPRAPLVPPGDTSPVVEVLLSEVREAVDTLDSVVARLRRLTR